MNMVDWVIALGLSEWFDLGIFSILMALFMYVFVYNTVTLLHKVYLIFHFLIMIWPLGQFAVRMTNNSHFQFIYINVSFVILSFVGFGWLLYLRFLINPAYVPRIKAVLIMLLPALIIAAGIAFNPGGVYILEADGSYDKRGPIFWFLVIVLLSYCLYSAILINRAYRSEVNAHYKSQIAYALTGLAVLVVFGIFGVVWNVVLADMLPEIPGAFSAGIAIAAIFFVLSIHKRRSIDIVSIAKQDVIDTIAAGIIVLDGQERVVEMNRLLSPELRIKIGSRLNMEQFLQSMSARKDEESFLKAYRSSPPGRASMEVAVARDDGVVHLSLSAAPIMGDHNRIIGRVVTFQDVTELRRLVDASSKQYEALQERNRALIQMQDKLFQANRQLEQMAITDSMTGCFNRWYLMGRLEQELARDSGSRQPFAIILFDIDFFKEVNDSYGHLVGDEVIRQTARVVSDSLRETDLLARYGGEEFAVYLPQADRLQARRLAERLCQTVESNHVPAGKDEAGVSVTISIGVLSIDGDSERINDDAGAYLHELFSKADAALYEAKEGGRNRIVHYQD